MKLALFGATGRIGGQLLSLAMSAGHQVHVLTRAATGVVPSEGVTITRGDVLDPDTVAGVVSGADAVLSALGPRGLANFRGPALLAPAAASIVTAMRQAGCTRLVMVSAAGAFIAGDPHAPWLARQLVPRIFAHVYTDVRAMEQVIGGSGLDWTLVRPVRLTNAEGTGRYRVAEAYPPPGGSSIARADVAHFMHTALTGGSHLREHPAVAY